MRLSKSLYIHVNLKLPSSNGTELLVLNSDENIYNSTTVTNITKLKKKKGGTVKTLNNCYNNLKQLNKK